MSSLEPDEILRLEGLQTQFDSEDGPVRSVAGVDLALRRGETLAIVGESGSGKSVTCLSVMRLIQSPGRISGGTMAFRSRDGTVHDLAALPERAMQAIRGNEIAMIFQEPMTSMNPLYTIGDQIAEVVEEHQGFSRREAWVVAVDSLKRVGIADPERRAHDYPHQMSGGMRQRAMIAMALACNPAILLADEPTTALDVTIQAQILDLLQTLKSESSGGMGIVFVTHNMGVVAEMADRVMVMYAGQVVETGTVRDIFRRPRHPYTRGLLGSIARSGSSARGAREPLAAIRGNVPSPLDLPPGCAFAPRCDFAVGACSATMPDLEVIAPGHMARCLRWRDL
jgi:peptide/nickel transport system ATP-binding protein/oligopeptide transport system ATP-binding protein